MTTTSRRGEKRKPWLADLIFFTETGLPALAIAWLWRTIDAANRAGDALPIPFDAATVWVIVGVTAAALAALLWRTDSKKQQTTILKYAVHIVALAPALRLFWEYWYWAHLSSEWFRDSTFFTGRAAISMLMLSLMVTPLNTLFGWTQTIPLRKPLGNYAFVYVCLHLMLFTFDYALLNQVLMLDLAVQEAIRKQYALVGFVGFVLLVPLAATSNKWAMKKLGKRWKQLHKLAYLIGVLGVVHFIWVWASKRALQDPLLFAAVLAILLLVRVKPVKDRIIGWRRDFKKARLARQRG